MDLDRAAEACREQDGDGFVWIGSFEPDQDELAAVQKRFGLDDLAIEDAQSFHLRPKVEQYDEGTVLFTVLRTAHYLDEREAVEFGEISAFLSPRFIITVRQGAASELSAARSRLERQPDIVKHGSGVARWAILDKVVDD